MKGSYHLLFGTLFFLVLWGCLEAITITMIAVGIAFTVFPDSDWSINSHRNWIFHGIIPWIIVWYFNPSLITVMICVGVGIHLLCDITPYKAGWKGGYLIKWYHHGFFWWSKGNQGKYTTAWLLGNFILSIVILAVEVLR